MKASTMSSESLRILVLVTCIHAVLCNDIEAHDPKQEEEDLASFFDMESLKTFYYKGGYLSIYERRKEKVKRYYITPLTELIAGSARCFEPGVTKRHKVSFDIEMWNSEVAEEAVKALAAPPLNLEVRKEYIHPLPILQVRLSVHGNMLSDEYEPETDWQSNLNQRLQHTFTIYAPSKEACERMVTEFDREPKAFSSIIQLEMAMTIEKRASKEISVTSENIGKSKIFARLLKLDQTEGDRLLTSSDLNHLAQEIVSSIVASETTSGDWVDQKEQISFARLLEHQLVATDTINTKQLTADQWKSVFWQEEFVRPDRYTSYLNRFMKYDEGAKKFSFDNETESSAFKHVASDMKRDSSHTNSWSAQAQVSILGGLFGGGGGGGSSEEDHQSSQDKNEMDVDNKGRATMSIDQMQHFLNKRNLQVEWNGEVFVSKSLDLHRINTAQLQSKTTIATQQIQVKTVPITVKLDTVASTNQSDAIAKEHIRILIDQIKSELIDNLEQLNATYFGSLLYVDKELKGQISNQQSALQQTKLEIQETKHTQEGMNKDYQQTKQEILHTKEELSRTSQEFREKSTDLQRLISNQVTRIDQISANVNSLQHPPAPAVNCETIYTGCNFHGHSAEGTLIHLDRHPIKCSQPGQYMTAWAFERCNPNTNFHLRIVCCK